MPKSMAAQTSGQSKSTDIQYCIRAIACEVLKLRSVNLINFCGGEEVIAPNFATDLILDHYHKF